MVKHGIFQPIFFYFFVSSDLFYPQMLNVISILDCKVPKIVVGYLKQLTCFLQFGKCKKMHFVSNWNYRSQEELF